MRFADRHPPHMRRLTLKIADHLLLNAENLDCLRTGDSLIVISGNS